MTFGCIHGRFQPFHKGHFEYLSAAWERCNHLIIGIAQYDRNISDESSPEHRMQESENPFSFWERVQIIRAALRSACLDERRSSIVPFPIHDPKKIRYFVEPSAIMFTTVYDEWNRQKIRRLEEEGFSVEILWSREVKEYEGKQVRTAMRTNFDRFKSLVPAGVPEAVGTILDGKKSL